MTDVCARAWMASFKVLMMFSCEVIFSICGPLYPKYFWSINVSTSPRRTWTAAMSSLNGLRVSMLLVSRLTRGLGLNLNGWNVGSFSIGGANWWQS